MVVLAVIGALALILVVGLTFGWLTGLILTKAFENKLERIVRKCRENWRNDDRQLLKERYLTEKNYIDETIDRVIRESEIFD